MAKPKTDTKTAAPQQEAPKPAPEVMLPAKTEGESASFKTQLLDREEEYRTLLPGHITPQRFMTVAQTAVKKNPKLLNCTPRSLFLALSQAAQDGLLPDGREGIINDYNTKVTERGQPDRWEQQAKWLPMVFGIRKRARETDNLIIDAQVVHQADIFVRHQGDNPKIIHEPAPLDKDPGPMIGAYAIFKYEDGNIIHRETMRASDIEAVKAKSKSPDGMMWKDFTGEAWRKTVIHRGKKTVPVSPELERIINRVESEFDFNQDHAADQPALQPPSPPSPPSAPAVIEGSATETGVVTGGEVVDEYQDWKRDQYAELEGCESEQAVEDIRERVLADLRDEDKIQWKQACADKATALFNGRK